MAPKPIVVIVPGAWSTPKAYRKLREALEAKDFKVVVPELSSNNGARPPTSTYETDVEGVRAAVEPLVNEGSDVFMLMHSYGGAVGSDAIAGLAKKDREAKGLPGGIIHNLYLSAYLLHKGQSVWKVVEKSGIGDTMIGHVTVNEDQTWLPNDAVWAMYHDLDPADQEEQKNLVMIHNLGVVYGETKYEAWKDIPSTYVKTLQDRWVPPVYQEICLDNAKEAGVPLDLVEFDCAHSAYAKYPEKVTELVIKAISK